MPATPEGTVPIPLVSGLPIFGSIFDLNFDYVIGDFMRWVDEYGEIYRLKIMGKSEVFINSARLAAEVLDEKRFHKQVEGTTIEVMRSLGGDALFTAYHGEENWGVAHRILMPVFGPAKILGMFDDMNDILSQLVLKWERFGPNHQIDPNDDFTRLAFDTVAFCSMSYRLNSFYTETKPRFVEAMSDWLTESGHRFMRPAFVQKMLRGTNKKYKADIKIMRELADKLIADRKASPNDRNDLLNAMLNGRDPKTGKGLTDKSITEQLMTVLIAGHETTSNLLSFVMYYVVKSSEVYAKLQAEIDSVMGSEPLKPEHLKRTPYIIAVIREALRLGAPIIGIEVGSSEDQIVGGRYLIPAGEPISVLTTAISRDPAVYDEPEEFKPERMMDGKFEALPPKAWLPFGSGSRACIGRAFALQEAQMAIMTLFQRFEFRFADPNYTLKMKMTLTLKPKDFKILAISRRSPSLGVTSLLGNSKAVESKLGTAEVVLDAAAPTQNAYFLFGSNSGSCEMFAQRLASEAASQGFNATVSSLDEFGASLPSDGPVIIIAASFEGEPADNAINFVHALTQMTEADSLSSVKFAVFGCGHRDWSTTYQKVPIFIDEKFKALGATRLLERGDADAGGEHFLEDFDVWEMKLWPVLAAAYNVSASARDARPRLEVKLMPSTERASHLRQDSAGLGVVLENRILTKPGAVEKRHVEIQLPEGSNYNVGDYLCILPTNPKEIVERVLKRFNLSPEQHITLSSRTTATLPLNRSLSVSDLFSGYVELGQPATRKDLETLQRHAPPSGATAAALTEFVSDYSASVLGKHRNILSILVAYPDIDLPLATFLEMLPSMRPRQYSISSSPLVSDTRAALTLSVLQAPSLANVQEMFNGVGSTFLAGLQPGALVQVALRHAPPSFRLPADANTPVVMFSSGAGIAPFRGFIQERATQKARGVAVGRMLLFFGCRHPELDFLYSDTELKEWVEQDVVEVRTAFSRASDKSHGCRYVQDRVWHDRADVYKAVQEGARFFTCGSTKVASGVKTTMVRVLEEYVAGEATAVWAKIQKERWAVDVFN